MKIRTLTIALLFLGTSLWAQQTRPFSVDDMLAMKRISGHQVSPDGSQIVFSLRTTDLAANRGRTDLWLVKTDGSGLRRLTSNPEADFGPLWSVDGGEIYFLSTRSGSSQVWRISLAGGEAEQVTALPFGIGNLLLSPDGSTLAVTLEVYPDCRSIECTANHLHEQEAQKFTGQVYDKLFVRHWDTWEDGRRSHLFILPVEGGQPTAVMTGMDADTPSKPFGGPEEIAFTPDGKGLVFTARNEGAGEAWSTNFDLYWVPTDGSKPPRKLTSNPAWDTSPAFSPDGKTLAYLAMTKAGFEADRFRIMLMDWPGGTPRTLTEDWDRSPGGLVWSSDGRTIYTTASNLGHQSLFAVDASSGAVKTLLKEGTIGSPAEAGNRLVIARDDLVQPVELYSVNLDGSDLKRVTNINEHSLSRARLGTPEQFTFKGWNDETVHAWVVKPVDFNPSLKYPVAFLIHGGPQGSFGNHFHYRWNPQAYAGAGYAAVMVDFHGSTGYGQAFTDSITGDWGGKPLVDLQKGLAAALERYPWMDGERVGALGASYGGYMINWIAGNWPDRFKCLVNHDGEFDSRMMYYVTEELWFPEWEQGGPYWQNPEGHEKYNPARFVEHWKTPMLVIHGLLDHRVPLGQGLATFTALQRKSIPSRFLYFPDENHWVLKPQNSIQWHEEVIGWMDKWLK